MLFRKSVFCFIAGLLLASVSASVSAGGSIPDIRQNGWVHPVGDYRSYESCAQFGGPSTGGYDGHVGSDLCRSSGTSVVAIADGCVQDYNDSLTGYGGTGERLGGAVLLRHKTESGRIFYAVYGHITLNTAYLKDRRCSSVAKSVAKGDEIGKVDVYVEGANHLHSGIRPDSVDPLKPFRGVCTGGDKLALSDNCGWVNPFEFLNANRPAPSIYACAPVSGSERACWRTRTWFDTSCTRGSMWFIHNVKLKTVRLAFNGSGVCPLSCYAPIPLSFLDFLIAPAYAGTLDSCSAPDVTVADTTPSGSGGTPVSGKRSDITPNYDVYHQDGHEISADCRTCKTESVTEGQRVRDVLKMLVANDGAKDNLRIKDRKYIRGVIWYAIHEKDGSVFQPWAILPGGDFDIHVDRLDKGRSPDEEVWSTIPDFPDKVLVKVDCVDVDDEVYEQKESSTRRQITSPDNCGTNNLSRKERFLILPEPRIPCGVITKENWVSGGWSGLGSAAPFDQNGTDLSNVFCRKNRPDFIKATIGNAGNPMVIVYLSGYVKHIQNGGFLPQTFACDGLVNGGWCAGTAMLNVSHPGINTAPGSAGTEIYFHTCELVSGAWRCASGWQKQVARVP